MSLNDDQKDIIIKCKLCSQSFNSWSDERIRLHIESCSERKARLLSQCPSCAKALSKATALKHTKACANFLNISLIELFFLNGDIPPDTLINGKTSRSSKLPKSKLEADLKIIKKASKGKILKSCVNTVDHLLISLAERRKIFINRLSDILRKEHFDWNLSETINCQSSYSSPLWDLSFLPPENKSEQFYVDSLSNLVTPSRKTKTHNPLRMSQIPGRSPSSVKKNRFSQIPEHMKQPKSPDIKNLPNEMLLKMVGTPLCSDLSICLDSGESIPAHRFILAAWSSELALLSDNTSSISAPGLGKEELLKLLRALYAFDFSYFSSLSPEAEFTLDCWQMLDIVRSKSKTETTSRFSVTPKIRESTNVHGSASYNSGVDLFATEVVECTDLRSPRTSLNPKTISPSDTTVQVDENPVDKSVQSSVNIDAPPRTLTTCDSILPPTPVLFKPNVILTCQSTPYMQLFHKNVTTEVRQPEIITPSPEDNTISKNKAEKLLVVPESAHEAETEYVFQNVNPKSDIAPMILETPKNTMEAVFEQVDTELKKSPQSLVQSSENATEMIIEQRDIKPEESSISTNDTELVVQNEKNDQDSSPPPVISSSRKDAADVGKVVDMDIENMDFEPTEPWIVVDSPCNDAMELDIQSGGDGLGKPSSLKDEGANAEDIDNILEDPQLLLASSSPRNENETENDAPFTQSPCHSVDLDPPSFGGGFDEFHSFDAEKQHVPISAQKRSSRHLDLEDQEASSSTLIELEPTSPPAISNDSIFSNASAPTPAPLAKRLRASVETVEEAEAVFSLSSQPLLLDHLSDKENISNEDENHSDLHVSFSLSQPTPCTPVANKRRVTSVILTDVPITPKPAFESMPTPELRKALSEYGIRRLPKKKAVKLLNHIYDELHPYVEVPTVIEHNEPTEENLNNEENSPFAIVTPTTTTHSARSLGSENLLEGVSNSEIERPASTQITFSASENETFSSCQQVSSRKNKPTPEGKNDALKARIWECLRGNDQLYYNIITYVPLELDCVKAMLRDAGINVGLRRLSDLLHGWGVTFTTRNRHTAKPGMDTSDPTSANYLW